MFHTLYLTPFVNGVARHQQIVQPPPALLDEDGGERFEVEEIRDSRLKYRQQSRTREVQYLIKWKDYPESENTWERHFDVDQSRKLLNLFHQLYLDKPSNRTVRHVASSWIRRVAEYVGM